jgi:signal transduction histidine kinase
MIGHLPVRWRLTLWYMALTTLVLVSFSIAVYIGLERRLSSNLDEDLRSQAALASASITFGADELIIPSLEELSDEVLVKVVYLDGETEYLGGDLPDVPVQLDDVNRAAAGRPSYRTVSIDGQELRLITVPIRTQGGIVVGAVQMGMSTERIEEALELLVQALFVIAPVAIVLAAGTGYMLAGRALGPVADITTLAGQISGNDLHTRLNLDLPNDELGRLASTFDSMLGRIDEAFQRQRQFTGDAAHELRTPLALMRSQIDLALTQADTSEELRDALQALDGDVGQMTTLVGTLLAIARADAGALTPNRESVDLADLASDVCDQYAPIASQNGLTLTCEVRPVTVQADADMIIQVIVNLVDNAIKNTAEGGTITIRTGRGTGVSSQGSPGLSSRESRHEPPPPDSWPRLTIDAAFVQVTDTGAGIPAEHLPRIFDRFYRVDSGRTRNKGGIGLGLAISQSIARVHGGMLSATSVPGKGSTFTLTLPA